MKLIKSTLRGFSCVSALALCALFTHSVFAQTDDPAGGNSQFLYEKGGIAGAGLVAGLKVGGGFGQPFNEFGSSFVGELELGYNLPMLDRSLGLFFSGQYAQPTTEGSNLEDTFGPADGDAEVGSSRLPGPFSYQLEQRQAVLTFGAIYRIPAGFAMFRPYFALGGRYYMLSTKITGESDGQPFFENTETGSTFGFYGALGGELYLGPGAILLEVQTGAAGVDQFILRDTNASALNVALGYRFFL